MSEIRACNCIGPQNGQPRCPCMMRGLVERDGRWIEPERDLGPVRPDFVGGITFERIGCICPPTSERTCQSPVCPRKPILNFTVTGPATPKSMEDWRASQIAKGVAKSFAVNDYQMSCKLCQKPRAWRRSADGEIRAISHA